MYTCPWQASLLLYLFFALVSAQTNVSSMSSLLVIGKTDLGDPSSSSVRLFHGLSSYSLSAGVEWSTENLDVQSE